MQTVKSVQLAMITTFTMFCHSAIAAPDRAQIDTVFAAYDNSQSPGCSLGVFRSGEIEYAHGYGMANLEYGIANGPDTVFRIGSTSKQFTAMAIALLAEQGKLSLDDDIHKFFPQMPDYGVPVTVRQLVHHTSGVRDYLQLAWMADWGELFTVEEAVGIITSQEALNFSPNSEHLYSNSGYFLMSQIVEIVTGQTLQQFADKNIFEPLGMSNTHFQDDHRRIVPNRADGYADARDGGFNISMTQLDMVGDGSIYTTVSDMFFWDQNFYNNKLGKGGPALIKLVTSPGVLDDGEVLDYAFGLGVGEYAGTKEISHGGSFVGYRAGYNSYPGHKLGVSVLCNYANANPTGLAQQVASLFLGEVEEEKDIPEWAFSPETEEVTQTSSATEKVSPSAESLATYAGSYYSSELDHTQTLNLNEGVLTAIRRGDDLTLKPSKIDVFDTDWFNYQFTRDATGVISGFKLNSGRVRNISYQRQ